MIATFSGVNTGQFARRLLTQSRILDDGLGRSMDITLTAQLHASDDTLRQNVFVVAGSDPCRDQCWFAGITNGAVGDVYTLPGFVIGKYSFGAVAIRAFAPLPDKTFYAADTDYTITFRLIPHGIYENELQGWLNGVQQTSLFPVTNERAGLIASPELKNGMAGYGTFQGVVTVSAFGYGLPTV